jgi:hypothetical protein
VASYQLSEWNFPDSSIGNRITNAEFISTAWNAMPSGGGDRK